MVTHMITGILSFNIPPNYLRESVRYRIHRYLNVIQMQKVILTDDSFRKESSLARRHKIALGWRSYWRVSELRKRKENLANLPQVCEFVCSLKPA